MCAISKLATWLLRLLCGHVLPGQAAAFSPQVLHALLHVYIYALLWLAMRSPIPTTAPLSRKGVAVATFLPDTLIRCSCELGTQHCTSTCSLHPVTLTLTACTTFAV